MCFGGMILTNGDVELVEVSWRAAVSPELGNGGYRLEGNIGDMGRDICDMFPCLPSHLHKQQVPGNHTIQPLTLKLL